MPTRTSYTWHWFDHDQTSKYFTTMNFRLFARPAAIALSTGAMYSQCEPAISKKEFKPFKLEKIENLVANVDHRHCGCIFKFVWMVCFQTHNTKLFRLKLPKQDDTMGMTCAGMLMVQGEGKDGKRIACPYTPVSYLMKSCMLSIEQYLCMSMNTVLVTHKIL